MGKGIEFCEWVARLAAINAKLVEFPTPTDYKGSKYFGEAEFKCIIMRAFSRSFRVQLNKSGKSLDDFTLQSLQEYMEACLEEGEKLATENNIDKND